jgi:hypothetical protein
MGRSVATQPPPPEEGERGARVPASRGNAGGRVPAVRGNAGGRVPAVRGSAGPAFRQVVGTRGGRNQAVEGNIHLSRLAGGHRVQGQPVRDFKGMANPHRLHDMVI